MGCRARRWVELIGQYLKLSISLQICWQDMLCRQEVIAIFCNNKDVTSPLVLWRKVVFLENKHAVPCKEFTKIINQKHRSPYWFEFRSLLQFQGYFYLNLSFYFKIASTFMSPDISSSTQFGPPLFGLPPNGLFTFGLSLIGLQGQLDYTQLDYLWRLDYRRLDYKPLGLHPIGLPMTLGLPPFGLHPK